MALDIGPEGFDPGIPGTGMNILGGDTDGNRYLLAVSAILVKAAELRDGPVDASLQELMNTISADLEESVELGTPIVDELRAAEAALDPVAVMAMLAARFGELGSSAEVPDIRHVIDRDNDGVVNIDDPDDTNPGI
jgi:hypothetical protein